jgi:hypothetical protein
LLDQPGYAVEIAEIGKQKFGDPLFDELANVSVALMRQYVMAAWPQWPWMVWAKLKAIWRK